MTRWEALCEEVTPYVRDLADRMVLKDWTIKIRSEPADNGNNAQIYCVEGQKWANVYLNHDFFDRPPEEQRKTLVHELTHCHFDQAARIATKDMQKPLEDAFKMALEYGVDASARALAPHLPLPPSTPETLDLAGDLSRLGPTETPNAGR